MATSLVSAPAADHSRPYLFPIASSSCVFFSALGARTSRGAVITSCNSSATLRSNKQEQQAGSSFMSSVQSSQRHRLRPFQRQVSFHAFSSLCILIT
ncbi:hypothetical protein NC652_031525 [Populus alba x Populus x berolinensis]|nr:hypothetical protein NC652_031525 [Populus alba x Populus x berolinensis]